VQILNTVLLHARLEGTGLDGLDNDCVHDYGADLCAQMKVAQNVTATLLDTMRAAAYEPHLYGKVDVGYVTQ